MDQPPAPMMGRCVGFRQCFACMLDVTQILFREVRLRREAIFLDPKGSTQVALDGLFFLGVSVDQHIRWETVSDCL